MKRFILMLLRGSVAFLGLLLMIASSIFIIQSCTDEIVNVNPEQQQAIEDFKRLALAQKPVLENIKSRYEKLRRSSNPILSAQSVELQKQSKAALQTLFEGSRSLLRSYGFTEADFEGTAFGMDDPRIIYISFAILKIERLQTPEQSLSEIFIGICSEPAFASQFWDCAKRAIGIDVAIEVFRNSQMATIGGRKLLIKTFTKVGARYLGWIGVGIATYDFIDCMWM